MEETDGGVTVTEGAARFASSWPLPFTEVSLGGGRSTGWVQSSGACGRVWRCRRVRRKVSVVRGGSKEEESSVESEIMHDAGTAATDRPYEDIYALGVGGRLEGPYNRDSGQIVGSGGGLRDESSRSGHLKRQQGDRDGGSQVWQGAGAFRVLFDDSFRCARWRGGPALGLGWLLSARWSLLCLARGARPGPGAYQVTGEEGK